MRLFEMLEGTNNSNHGTDRTKRYSLSDVNNTPPADYVIPEGLVRDAKDKAYEKYFPKDSIQTVKVEMDEGNLNYMLQHAGDKPSVMTNRVTIGYADLKGTVSLAEAGRIISATNTDKGDPKGSVFATLRLKGKGGKKSVKLSWTKVKGADGYIIYCGCI